MTWKSERGPLMGDNIVNSRKLKAGRWLLLMLGLALFAAACGDSDDDTTEADGGSEESTPEIAEESDDLIPSAPDDSTPEIADETDDMVPDEPTDDEHTDGIDDLEAFDQVVFACGEEVDWGACQELEAMLDADAQLELIDRCDINDQVACGALNNTVVAGLQVQCVYEDDASACEGLELSWGVSADGNYGLGNSMSQTPMGDLEGDCAFGSKLACAELNLRQEGQGE